MEYLTEARDQIRENMKHTPGPWKIFKKGYTNHGYIGRKDASVAFVSAHGDKLTDEDLANAEFIVRACNSHDDLLEACYLIRDRMDLGRVVSKGTNRVRSYEIKGKKDENIKDIIQIFKTAIAKAEGKEV